MAELSKKQEAFCREYIIDLNGAQAAIRAGYSKKTARSQANRLLTNVDIQNCIAELLAERNSRVQVDADYVLARLVEIDQMDVIDIMDDHMNLKPISEWPSVWRRYLSGFDLAELFSGRGEEREMIGILKKIKWPDKVKNLELLGKHTNVQAFKERIDHTSSDGSMTPRPEMTKEELQESLKELGYGRGTDQLSEKELGDT